MSKFKVHHPEFYPVGWMTGAKNSLATLKEGELCSDWVSVDWARGEAGAVARMCRLRAFRDGLFLYPDYDVKMTAAIRNGYRLHFCKVFIHRVWDVRLCWVKPSEPLSELLADYKINS